MSENRDAYCSFCKKSFHIVGPLVEGPQEVYICGECVELSQRIMLQEKFRRRSNDPDAYVKARINQLVEAVEIEVWTSYPPMLGLCEKAAGSKEPVWFQAIAGLYESTGLLSIGSAMLERVKAKGLNSEEQALLEDVAPKVAELKAMVKARADKELEGLS